MDKRMKRAVKKLNQKADIKMRNYMMVNFHQAMANLNTAEYSVDGEVWCDIQDFKMAEYIDYRKMKFRIAV